MDAQGILYVVTVRPTIQSIILFFEQYAERVPLELFVLVGTFIEELISPIPSFVVLIPAGAAAGAAQAGIGYILLLCVCSAIGRIAGGSILYGLADKVEDFLLTRKHPFFGLSHTQVEKLGRRLGKSKRREFSVLFIMNALPIFPAAILSLACGFIKVRFTTFLAATFFGTMVNALIYLYIGYMGLKGAALLQHLELASQITTAILVVGVVVWFYLRRRKRTT